MNDKTMTRERPTVKLIIVLAAFTATACQQDRGGQRNGDAAEGVGTQTGSTAGEPASGSTGADADGGSDDAPGAGSSGAPASEEPFVPPTDEVQLLPFPVRMTNLAQLLDVPSSHAMFTTAYELRLLLGDHDFSQQHAPDLRWTAERMHTWVRALVPICGSEVVRFKYPSLHQSAGALMRDAYGRDPSLTELESVEAVFSSAASDNDKARLVCLTVLSSLDFVAY